MNDKHPHYDVIVAWAEGKTIQYWCQYNDTWIDWDIDPAPPFHTDREYRVKPETIRYRTYLRKITLREGGYCVDSVLEADNERQPREEWPQFVRWLGDWQEVEI